MGEYIIAHDVGTSFNNALFVEKNDKAFKHVIEEKMKKVFLLKKQHKNIMN